MRKLPVANLTKNVNSVVRDAPSPLNDAHVLHCAVYNFNILVGCKHRASEILLYIGGRGLVSQIIEPVTFARL